MFTKKDLHAGDVCVTRSGVVMITMPQFNGFICISGWDDLHDYDDNFKSLIGGKDYDIVTIYRPEHMSQCSFSHYAYSTAEIVYNEKLL